MKILITGGAGFIGTNLAWRALLDGHEVAIIDNLSARGLSPELRKNVAFSADDITSGTGSLRRMMEKVDAVVHLAAHVSVPASIRRPFFDLHQNIIGTLHVLEACKGAGISNLVVASSNAVYGDTTGAVSPTTPCRPQTPYGASKLAAEQYCWAYADSVNSTILRFSNVYGPHSAHTKNVTSIFALAVRTGDNLVIFGDGEQTRDFLYVDDLADAILALLGKEDTTRLFTIGSGQQVTVNVLADIFKKASGKNLEVVRVDRREGDIRHNYSDIADIGGYLPWKARTSLARGIARTIEKV